MRPKFFYGYVILGLCFINMVVMRGVNGAFGVYYLALLEEFGWSRSDGASIASINFVVYALAAPVVGFAFDRLGPRWAPRLSVSAFFFLLFPLRYCISTFHTAWSRRWAKERSGLSVTTRSFRSGSCASARRRSASLPWGKAWALS
jgi:MFS family permease